MSPNDSLFDLLHEAEENDQLATARFLYEAILAEDPDNAALLVLHASNLIELGDYLEAETVLQRVEESDDPEVKSGLLAQQGNLARARGNFETAEKCYREAHQLDPEDSEHLLRAATMAMQQSELARAEYLIREAIKLDGDLLSEAWFDLGGCLVAQQRYQEARTCYEKVLETDPANELAEEWLDDLNQLESLISSDEA